MKQPLFLQTSGTALTIIALNGLIRTLARERIVIVPTNLYRELEGMFSDLPQVALVPNRETGFLNGAHAAERLGVEIKTLKAAPGEFQKLYDEAGVHWSAFRNEFRNHSESNFLKSLVDHVFANNP